MSGGGFGLENAMDLDKGGGGLSASCSICLEVVLDQAGRSIAKLQCGHEFHLDCIGSAFNAKGAMQCPNCRKVEKGRWLYANGHRSVDFDLDSWVTEDFYDLSFPELPFGFQWCPFRGLTQLASFIEEGESQQNSYNEPMGNAAFGDHSSAAISTHVCPYLAQHGFPRAMPSAPSSSAESVPDNAPFHRHPTSLGGQSSADMINYHSSATELRNHEWLQRPSFPLSSSADQSASHLGMRLSRNDGSSSQQRLGSFVHPLPLVHGDGSSGVPSLAAPLTGEVRGGHTRGGHGGLIYQQSASSSTLPNSPFAPTRRARARPRPSPSPRGVSLISSVATSSSAGIGGFYGFSVNRNHQDSENTRRHLDRIYGWGREGFTPLPWFPLEGESQWWSPFNPNPSPQSGSFPQRAAAERTTQNRPENGYQRMPPPRMSPFI